MSSSTRKIGGEEVSAMGFGAMVLAGAYGTAGEEEERFKVRCQQHRRAVMVITELPYRCWTLHWRRGVPSGTPRTPTGTLRISLESGMY